MKPREIISVMVAMGQNPCVLKLCMISKNALPGHNVVEDAGIL